MLSVFPCVSELLILSAGVFGKCVPLCGLSLTVVAASIPLLWGWGVYLHLSTCLLMPVPLGSGPKPFYRRVLSVLYSWNLYYGAISPAQWLRTLAALTEAWRSIPSTQGRWLTITPVLRALMPPQVPTHIHTCGIHRHTCAQIKMKQIFKTKKENWL